MNMKNNHATNAKCITFFMFFFWIAYGGFWLIPGWAQPADNVPESRSLLEKIIQSSPSKSDSGANLLEEKLVEYRILQERNRMNLLIAIIISTPILLVIVLFCLKNSPRCSEESMVSSVGLVLVIEGTMFIGVSAQTNEQLTAPIGILGAIAGYLFGAAKRRAAEMTSEEPKK